MANERGFSHWSVSLWLYLRGWMHSDNKKCWTSQERIADDLRCSVRVVKKAVKESKEGGVLLVKRLPKTAKQQFDNNEYRFNFPWPALQKPGARQTPGARGTTCTLYNNKNRTNKEKKKEKKRPQKEGPFVVAKDSELNPPPGAPQTPGLENDLMVSNFRDMSEKEKQEWACAHVYDPYLAEHQKTQQSREAVLVIMEAKGVKGGKALLKEYGKKKVEKYLPFLEHKAGNPAGLFIAALKGDWVENRNLKESK